MSDHDRDGTPFFFDPEILAAADQAAQERVRALMEEANRLGPERFVELCAERDLIQEAEAAAAGYRYLTVVHGDLETSQDVDRFEALTRVFWEHPASTAWATQGGNDYITFRAGPPRLTARLTR
jgi:hypothetical protein